VKGVHLSTAVIGGRRYTSREAIVRPLPPLPLPAMGSRLYARHINGKEKSRRQKRC
jgi:hypothetical protein